MSPDGWIHAHWQQLLLGLVVTWAIIVFAWKSLTNKFVTKDHLQSCRDDVREVDENLDKSIRKGIAELSVKIDRLDDRRREDAMANEKAFRKFSAGNSSEHQGILHDIANLHNGVK